MSALGDEQTSEIVGDVRFLTLTGSGGCIAAVEDDCAIQLRVNVHTPCRFARIRSLIG